jgi:DNA primase
MPDRIIDNLLKSGVNIAVINWSDLTDWMGLLCDEGANKLRQLIDNAFKDRASNDYDLTRPMRMRNS